MEEWYALIAKLQSTQFIVMPQADHGPLPQYPDLAARYITVFIENLKILESRVTEVD
jgi:hypothetical protein